ncbi:FAD-dependent oxidoreductase [Celeribacter sp.]|uniref:FAD-dependent oxidoreductase n=1 Tax=Celeribacter sp. TaxID=1890673 RepID=UPI003A923B24
MIPKVDLLIVGAGPAGMSAAIEARKHGLTVMVMDEQPAPGGQIWRAVEAVATNSRASLFGRAYLEGQEICRQFRGSGATYFPNTRVWNIENGQRIFASTEGKAFCVDTTELILATGAQERPAPFKGWTLPGVLTVGAAQILLKAANQVPKDPVWIVGSGPLALLYANQLLKAGGQIAGFVETSPRTRPTTLFPRAAKAMASAPGEILKGLGWVATVRRNARYFPNATKIQAHGNGVLEELSFTTRAGRRQSVKATTLLVHEGIVPSIHTTQSIGCDHLWDPDLYCHVPAIDDWGETSKCGVYVAGDGARIGGAQAACLRGKIAAIRVAVKSRKMTEAEAARTIVPVRSKLKSALGTRPLLNALYRPCYDVLRPSDDVIVCRCEEKTAGELRELGSHSAPDPNRVKIFSRAGMGPCQGRQCNATVTRLLADLHGRSLTDIGLHRIRPPLKPLTLSELASLNNPEESA